jgi:SAM-dependent methyltransferase
MRIKEWFMLPAAAAIADMDDPSVAALHAKIIQRKPFLRLIYSEIYEGFKRQVPLRADAKVVELGSGGGFIKEVIPNAITSDIRSVPGLDMHFSALSMPFPSNSLDALLMFDVFHHMPDVERFLREASRCLKPGGKILMVEPANTLWGRFIYGCFHHEPFSPTAGWRLDACGPMSSANGALPWIVFKRDLDTFQTHFPDLHLRRLRPFMPFRYILSGGVSMRQLMPSITYPLVKGVEFLLTPLNDVLGLFYDIEIAKLI